MTRFLALAALVAGCYHPTPQEGAACNTAGDCPDPLHCIAGICVRGAFLDAPGDGTAGTSDAPDAPVVDAPPPDGNAACSCSGDDLVCGASTTTCAAGCTGGTTGARCKLVVPSNNVTPDFPSAGTVTISADVTFDTDTGAITGAITRAAGSGVAADIGYEQQQHGSQLGVFSFHRLDVQAGATVYFTGARAAVFVVATDATIAGTIDGSGGCNGTSRACPGPGGGAGGTYATAAQGCGGNGPGAGGTGKTNPSDGADSGGGGGGGGTPGAPGGTETAIHTDGSMAQYTGGTGGGPCLSFQLEPLEGGGGGGGGGPGAAAAPTAGGGGGGALQLTVYDTLTISGTLDFGGEGGDTGPTATSNAGAPAGGGAGGGLLLEAPTVNVSGVLAANGGGGGGASDHTTAGTAGQDGQRSASPALGGTAANSGGPSGNGGAGTTAPTAGGDATNVNSGAGGGAVGRIFVRSYHPPALSGTLTPSPGTAMLRTQ